jgi:hypothetical protein
VRRVRVRAGEVVPHLFRHAGVDHPRPARVHARTIRVARLGRRSSSARDTGTGTGAGAQCVRRSGLVFVKPALGRYADAGAVGVGCAPVAAGRGCIVWLLAEAVGGLGVGLGEGVR